MQTLYTSSQDWLRQLDRFPINRPPDDWLRQHEAAIRSSIAHDLYYPPELPYAFELLVRVVPIYAVEFFHPVEWEPVLMDALLQAQELQDQPTVMRVYAGLGAAYYAMGRNTKALNAFEFALDRASAHQVEKATLAACIGLIRLQASNLSAPFEPELLARAEAASETDTHDETRAALYQARALVQINRWQLTEGLRWARGAFRLWRTLGEDAETAKTCYLMAVCCRMAGRFDRAAYWINRATHYFQYSSYACQNVILLMEKCVIAYERGDYREAESEGQAALVEALRLEAPQYINAVLHALGNAEIECEHTQDAAIHLNQALTGLQSMGNLYEAITVQLSLTHLEIKLNHIEAASQRLTEAEEGLSNLPPTQQPGLASFIQRYRQAIVG
jgi:tetratricopeptide (TPR) repeat protein